MQAGDVELGQIFTDNHQFQIPMFQRPYVWDQTKNWLPFGRTCQQLRINCLTR